MNTARREILADAATPDGDRLSLTREDGEYVVRVRDEMLMSSRQRGSEQAMVELAFEALADLSDARILIGGLGMGFTLRAALDRSKERTRITVVELFADVVDWNRGPLADLADHPLDDRRVELSVTDIMTYLATHRCRFDAILLDIDNGPEAFTVSSNSRLYARAGLDLLFEALSDTGVVVVWSAFRSRVFEQRLRRAGFSASSVTTRARGGVGKGARHTLFVAHKSARE